MARVGVGVIGAGFMGSLEAEVLAGFPDARVVVVCDPRPGAAAAARMLGADYTPDYRAVVDRSDVQAVVVSTPEDRHEEPCLAASAAGKHILVEKPIAASVPAGEAIVAAARRAGVLLMTGFVLRFEPRYAAVKEAAAGGEIGAVQSVTV